MDYLFEIYSISSITKKLNIRYNSCGSCVDIVILHRTDAKENCFFFVDLSANTWPGSYGDNYLGVTGVHVDGRF